MPDKNAYEYAVVQVVPSVERGEYINAGVILFCKTLRFLSAQVELDVDRLLALAPDADVDRIRAFLALIPSVCDGAGHFDGWSQSERFHWLTSPRSTIIQISPTHCGLSEEPAAELEHLMDVLVRRT